MTSPQKPLADKALENQKLQDQALDWFTRFQSGTVSDAERTEFTQWYAKSDKHAGCYDKVESLWESPALDIAAQRVEQKKSTLKPMMQQAEKITAFSWKPIWAIAASLFLFAIIGPNIINAHFNADIVTATGEQKLLKLDDGTQLTLNTESAVDIALSEQFRDVTLLDGEIYLDVTKDASRPFRVHVDDVLVKVLGTRFSVQRKKDSIVVSGHSGQIAVSTQNGEPMIITVGERIVVKAGELFSDKINPNQAFSWANNRFTFDDQPLGDVLAELDRYYYGKIVITNDEVAKMRISGSYSLTDPKKIAHSISRVAGVKDLQITPWLLVIR